MRPLYSVLKKFHYSAKVVSGEDLYDDLGHNYQVLQQQDIGYVNTCATRMSLALLKSGVKHAGRLTIRKGNLKGKKIETGAKLLADQLSYAGAFGKPIIWHDSEKFRKELGSRKGVVFFWKITGYGGGHIDLIELSSAGFTCNSDCFFNCKEIWFWELK